jgi:hypothetical protein
MRPVDGSFVVHDDGDALEVVARAAGPAGAVGVDLLGGLVSVELDAADAGQLVSVRFALPEGSAGLTPAQEEFLEGFFGGWAEDVVSVRGSGRSIRVGASRRPVSSLRGVLVDPAVTLLVGGVDALLRSPQPSSFVSVLVLAARVGAAEAGLALPSGSVFGDLSTEDLLGALPRVFPVPALEEEYRSLLGRAAAAGVLVVSPEQVPAKEARFGFEDPSGFTVSGAVLRSEASVRPVSGSVRGFAVPSGPRVMLDQASLVRSGVSSTWVGEGSLRVTVPLDGSGEVLWARVRSASGVVLAASPLGVPVGGLRSALLLVRPDEGLVLDVVSSVGSRLYDVRVSASSSAFAAGRRAARLERVGALDDAAVAWEECSAWHRVAGDAPREKLAVARIDRAGRRGSYPMPGFDVDGLTVIDAVLSRGDL